MAKRRINWGVDWDAFLFGASWLKIPGALVVHLNLGPAWLMLSWKFE